MPRRLPKIICEQCHKPFVPNLFFSSNCIHCTYESQSDFAVIRSFVRDNPGLTAIELAEFTGIKLANIMTFVKTELSADAATSRRANPNYDAGTYVDTNQGRMFTAKNNK